MILSKGWPIMVHNKNLSLITLTPIILLYYILHITPYWNSSKYENVSKTHLHCSLFQAKFIHSTSRIFITSSTHLTCVLLHSLEYHSSTFLVQPRRDNIAFFKFEPTHIFVWLKSPTETVAFICADSHRIPTLHILPER